MKKKEQKLTKAERIAKRADFIGNLGASLYKKAAQNSIIEQSNRLKKDSVVIGKIIRVTPAFRHAYFESNIGPIRKPL